MGTSGRKRSNAPARRREKATARTPVGSFGEWLQFLGVAPGHPYWQMPYWPPDVFALAAAFLRRTGLYVKFVNHFARKKPGRPRGDPQAPALGRTWRRYLSADLHKALAGGSSQLRVPPKIAGWWKTFSGSRTSFANAAADIDVQEAAWNLCIVSDVACQGIGLRTGYRPDEGKDGKDPFLVVAQTILAHRNENQSFCLYLPVDKIAVLGKQHTPQLGCTVRSLTHHLSYYSAAEIKASWLGPYARSEDVETLNLLLLPWPVKVGAGDFRMAGSSAKNPRFGYFEYRPRDSATPAQFRARVARALEMAREHSGEIHGIVFPELALSQAEFDAVEGLTLDEDVFLIAGVRGRVGKLPANKCIFQAHSLTADAKGSQLNPLERKALRYEQLKHHRWRLDREQILRYDLGTRLKTSGECWEAIHLAPREISFVTLTRWLTICVLICEDLARQDPISDVVRAVGPNLVFALLMDGPQLRNRWPSRYASVLAEDPGCSVLTLTSLGMAARSKSFGTVDRSTTIGLWRDRWEGEREIALDPGDDACILSLICRSEHEYTLDGRHDEGQAHFPVFEGTYSFSTLANTPTGTVRKRSSGAKIGKPSQRKR